MTTDKPLICPTCGSIPPMSTDGLERLLDDLDRYPPTALERIEVFLRRQRWALFIATLVLAYVAGRYSYPL